MTINLKDTCKVLSLSTTELRASLATRCTGLSSWPSRKKIRNSFRDTGLSCRRSLSNGETPQITSITQPALEQQVLLAQCRSENLSSVADQPQPQIIPEVRRQTLGPRLNQFLRFLPSKFLFPQLLRNTSWAPVLICFLCIVHHAHRLCLSQPTHEQNSRKTNGA